MMFSFFIVQETLYLYDKKRSARMRTRRKGRWLPRQPRLGARMCQGTFFFLCTSDGMFLLTVQQVRKAIFPAVSLPENPAKK